MAQQASGQPVAFNKPLSGPEAFGYERYAQIQKATEMRLPQAFFPHRFERCLIVTKPAEGGLPLSTIATAVRQVGPEMKLIAYDP